MGDSKGFRDRDAIRRVHGRRYLNSRMKVRLSPIAVETLRWKAQVLRQAEASLRAITFESEVGSHR